MVRVFCSFALAALLTWPQATKPPIYQAADQPGRWRPYEDPSPVGPKGTYLQNMHGRYHVSQAEFRTLLAKLDQIAGVFKQLPLLNPPVGFEVDPFRHIEVTAYSTDQPASAPVSCSLTMQFWDYFARCPTCKAGLSTEASGELEVWVNVIGIIYDAPRAFEKDAQGEMYLEPGIAGEVGGFPEYDTGYIVLTKIARPLWVPVSQERFIRSEIAPWASQIKGREANHLKQLIKALEDELAALSPSERAAPAYYRPGYRSERPSRLVSAGLEGAQRVVETNKAFFDPSLPKTSFQLLAVHGLWRVEEHLKEYPSVPSGRTDPASAAFLLKKRVDIRRSLNWKGLESLLDGAPTGLK